MDFSSLSEFEKDLKQLLKKYRSLNDDLSIVKVVLTSSPNSNPPYSYRIDNLPISTCVIKVKKIACKSLKTRGVNSGLRLIYAYFPAQERIVFIELYHKNDKQLEDRDRILRNFK